MIPLRYYWIPAALAAALLAACKREPLKAGTGAPSANRPAQMGPPSTQDIEKENRDKLLDSLYELGALENGTVFVDDKGESWARQSNGLMIHELFPSNDDQPPHLGQTVTITYVGTYPDTNRIFDQAGKDKPLKFQLGSKSIIKGLSLGLLGLHPHGRRRIYIPPELGYGAKGDPGREISGNQALIFEVELLSVSGQPITITADDLPKIKPLGPPNPGSAPASRP